MAANKIGNMELNRPDFHADHNPDYSHHHHICDHLDHLRGRQLTLKSK